MAETGAGAVGAGGAPESSLWVRTSVTGASGEGPVSVRGWTAAGVSVLSWWDQGVSGVGFCPFVFWGPVWLASGKNCMQTFACVWQKKFHVFGKLLHANSRCAGPDDLGGLTQSPVGPTNGPIPCPQCFHCHNQTHTIQATEFFPLQQPNKAFFF